MAADSLTQDLLTHIAEDEDVRYALRWMFKDGLETGFFHEFVQRAPGVGRALDAAGVLEHFTEYEKALRIDDRKTREARLDELEKQPNATWKRTRPEIREDDLPLLEALLDRCANIEQHASGRATTGAPSLVGARVRHKVFGEGTVVALTESNATVAFDSGAEKRLRIDFLERA